MSDDAVDGVRLLATDFRMTVICILRNVESSLTAYRIPTIARSGGEDPPGVGAYQRTLAGISEGEPRRFKGHRCAVPRMLFSFEISNAGHAYSLRYSHLS